MKHLTLKPTMAACALAMGIPIAFATPSVEFSEHLIADGYAYPYGIAAADLDGDGDLDLTSADATPTNRLYWFENDGRGEFRRHLIQENDPERLERHQVGDIDADGHLDVVIVKNLHGHLLWFKNSGRPTDGKLWKRHVITTELPGAYDVALADLDGDGDLDVAASSWVLGNQFAWFENDGTPNDGAWTKHLIEANVDETRAIRGADFDGDGDIDLLGTAAGQPKDIDGDGKPDPAPGFVLWYENRGADPAGRWQRHVIDDPPRPMHGEPIDMDGDGDIDIVMALGMSLAPDVPGTHAVVWYENTGKAGEGTWKKHLIATDLHDAIEAVAGDLDGDGDVDVAATTWRQPGRVVWFENGGDPKGSWTAHLLKHDWRSANQIIIADFNGDSRPDLAAAAERGSSELRWWRNEGRPRKAREEPPPGEYQVVTGRRQLFLDDHGVARTADLRRVLHRPAKRGAVIRSPDPAQTIQTRSAPAWDAREGVYKLCVLGIDQRVWRSRDGLNWIPFGQSGRGPGPAPDLRTDLVVVDPADPDPARRFKAALPNRGFAVSPDGVTWTKTDAPRIPSSDESNLSYDPAGGWYIHTVKRGGKYGRAVAIAVSRDFEKWTDLGVVFQADDRDQELGVKNIRARQADRTLRQMFHDDPGVYRVDVYNMGVFHYEGLYLGMPAMYHATGPIPNYPNTDGFHLVQLVMSRDLRNWKRLGDRQSFIGPSRIDSGAYDLTQILPPSAPVVRGDELWFYYTGLKYRASYNYVGKFPNGEYRRKPGLENDHGAVCLAVLRHDGFVSLEATEKEGAAETKRFRLPAKTMFVNANARQGTLRVELLDGAGKVVARSAQLAADATRGKLTWEAGRLSEWVGKPVSLRFVLSRANLYSYWFE